VTARLTDADLARDLADVLSRVARGERFVVERAGTPIAEIVPTTRPPLPTMREVIAAIGHLTPAGEGFADDLEAVQAAQALAEPPAWDN